MSPEKVADMKHSYSRYVRGTLAFFTVQDTALGGGIFPNVQLELVALLSSGPFLIPDGFIGILPLALICGTISRKGIKTCF